MFKFSRVAQAALTICALAATGSALAVNVQIDGFANPSVNNTSTYTSNISNHPGGAVMAGEFYGLMDGNSFKTFCVDVFAGFSWGPPPQPFTVLSGATAFGATKSTDVDRLFTNWYGSVSDAVTSTAFQLALWEIIYEAPGNAYSLSTDTFTASGGSSLGTVYTTANGWLSNLGSLGSTYQHVDVLHSDTLQDFTVVSTVPEPEGYALALASVGVLVGARRLKARHARD